MSGCERPDPDRELADRHRSGLGQDADHAEPGLVAEGAVEDAKAAQVAVGAVAGERHAKSFFIKVLLM